MKNLLVLHAHRSKDDEKKIEWQNSVLAILEKNIRLPKLVEALGRDNVRLQIRVSGFRTKDEKGDSEYLSDTTGNAKQDDIQSVFSAFSEETKILSSEIRATYLSEGFL